MTRIAAALLLAAAHAAQAQCPVQSLVSGDTDSGDAFGWAVAVNGSWLVVGAPFDDDYAGQGGDAYVFRRLGATWTEPVSLAPSINFAGQFYGTEVALDGDTAAVAGLNGDRVFVWEFADGSWTENAVLALPPRGTFAGHGTALALDPGRVVAGAPRADLACGGGQLGCESGAVWVWTAAAAGWQVDAVLTASDAEPAARFGAAVATDRETLVVGAPGAAGTGAVYVLEHAGPAWTEVDRLAPPGLSERDEFGWALAVEGDLLLVGAPGADGAGADAGAVWVFERAGGAFAPTQVLALPDAREGDRLGQEVALDGGRALFGVAARDGVVEGAGTARLFERRPGGFAESARLAAPTPWLEDGFGSGVALSGGTAAVGAWAGAGATSSPGRGFAYELGAVASYCTAKTSADGCRARAAGFGVPCAGVPGPFELLAFDAPASTTGLVAYGLSGRAALPFAGGLLCAQPPVVRTPPLASGPGGPGCAGSFAFDFRAWADSGADPLLAAGATVNAQFWFRDPAAPDGTGIGLSDAVELVWSP